MLHRPPLLLSFAHLAAEAVADALAPTPRWVRTSLSSCQRDQTFHRRRHPIANPIAIHLAIPIGLFAALHDTSPRRAEGAAPR